MSRMDWNADACSYTVGTGDEQVSISRSGNHITVRGGSIGDLSFRNKSVWGDDWQADFGWHTESGTYVFKDVVLHGEGDIEVWAHKGDQYRIVLEESVKGARVTSGWQYHYWDDGYTYEVIDGGFGINVSLGQGADVKLVNNTILQGTYDFDTLYLSTDNSCSFILSGTGKVYPPDTLIAKDIDCSRNLHMTISTSVLADSDRAAAGMIIRALQNVQIDTAQFAGTGGRPQLWFTFSRHLESFLGVDIDLQSPRVWTDDQYLTPYTDSLQLIVSPQSDASAHLLMNRGYPMSDQSTLWLAKLITDNEESWWLQDEAALYIPYPDGIDYAAAEQYDFYADFPTLDGNTAYTSKSGGITPTEYGLCIRVRELLPFVLRWEEKPIPGRVAWTKIVNGSYAAYAPDLTVTQEDGHYVIDGGGATTITGLTIDCTNEKTTMGDGTYTFRHAAIDGDVRVVSVDHHAYTLNLERSIAMDGGVSLDAGYIDIGHAPGYGDITANIACDTGYIGLGPVNHSFTRLVNEGTTGGVGMESCDYSRSEIINKSLTGGTIIQLDNHSTADIVSHSSVTHLICWLWGHSTATFTNNSKSIGLMDIGAEGGSELTFINNGLITNSTPDPERWDVNEWGDYAVMLGVDKDSRIAFTGAGGVLPGTQMYDYYLRDPGYGPRDGASVVLKVVMPEVTGDHEANRQAVYEIAKNNIALDWTQVRKYAGADHVVAVRRDEEDPAYTYVIDMKQPNLPAEDGALGGSIVQGGALGSLPPVDVPTLVLPDGSVLDASAHLIYDKPNTHGNGRIVYNVRLIGKDGDLSIPEGSILCLPYPQGLDMDSDRRYNIHISHYAHSGTEVYKTEDGTIDLRRQGLCIRVSSLSPFEITWHEPIAALRLPAGLKRLERSAFEGCGAVTAVVIPPSVTEIGEDAFRDCKNAILIVTPGSYAHAYAQEQGLEFEYAP